MLTPMFELSQDDDTITVTIYAPNARLQDTEVTVYNEILYFTSVPYYLRLHFPHRLHDSESGGCSATLDGDKCAFVVVCQKQDPGQHFAGLDMITSLLTPKLQPSKPKIEVIDGTATSPADSDTREDDLVNLDDEWLEPQLLPNEVLMCGYKYGFADTHSDLQALKEGLYGVLDLASPNNTSPAQRRILRQEDESTRFSDEHYLADLFEEAMSAEYFQYTPLHCTLKQEDVEYSSNEKAALLQLPRRELLVDSGQQEAQVLVGLLSLLLSWCYNDRITAGEECVAGAWNITKLSPLLSWLDCPLGVRDCVRAFIRRSLIFPLLRHFDFAQLIVADTAALLKLGRKQVLKSLLGIRKVFNETENFYLLNDLFITEYSVWVQTVAESKLQVLAEALERVKLQKCDLDLHLDALESVGRGLLEDRGEDDSDDDTENTDTAPTTATATSNTSATTTTTTTTTAATTTNTSIITTSTLHTYVSSASNKQATTTGGSAAEQDAVVKQLAKDLQILTFSNPNADGDTSIMVAGNAAVEPLLSPNNNTGVVSRLVSDSSSDSDSDSSSESDSSGSELSSSSSASSDSDDDDEEEDSSSALDSDDDECPPEQPPHPHAAQ